MAAFHLPPNRVGQHVSTGIATERSPTTRLKDPPAAAARQRRPRSPPCRSDTLYSSAPPPLKNPRSAMSPQESIERLKMKGSWQIVDLFTCTTRARGQWPTACRRTIRGSGRQQRRRRISRVGPPASPSRVDQHVAIRMATERSATPGSRTHRSSRGRLRSVSSSRSWPMYSPCQQQTGWWISAMLL